MTRRWIAAAVAGLTGIGTVVVAELPASAAAMVVVNGATTYQKIDGFGVSEAFGQANAIRNLADGPRQQALDMLFSPTSGAGFSILRNLIPADPANSIEPNAPAGPSATPVYVWNGSSDATDQGQLWLAKQAKTYGISTFYNDAWSAPGFMKTNGSEANGGALCGTPGASCGSGDWRQAYANYLTQHAKFWASAGLTPAYVGFVNEPSFKTSYSSMDVTPAQAADFVKVFGPTLRASGLSTKVACCDTLGFNQLPNYVNAVRADPSADANVAAFTSHGYSGAPAAPISTDGRPLWESEWAINGSTWNTAWDDGSTASGITWAQQIHTGLTAANLNAFLYWWGISATSHDSSLIGLSGSTLTASKRYYALLGYSRFIRPGATRIAATSADSTVATSAYRNTDGSTVIVALNTARTAAPATYSLTNLGLSTGTVTPYLTDASNSAATQTAIALGGGTFTATVPARSMVTYRITGGPAPSPAPTASLGCTATYQVVSAWQDGFQADVTVTNPTPAAINGWTVSWTLPTGQTISQLWNGTLSAGGSSVTVRNASWNATIAPGASTSFGFTGTGSPTPAPAPACTSP
jgi:O-glycosyl hydrolase